MGRPLRLRGADRESVTPRSCSMTWPIALLLALVYAADPPLTARAIPGPPSQVELRNTGTRRINAWAFAISAPNASGGIRRTCHSAGVYMSEVTAEMQRAAPHLR